MNQCSLVRVQTKEAEIYDDLQITCRSMYSESAFMPWVPSVKPRVYNKEKRENILLYILQCKRVADTMTKFGTLGQTKL